MEGNQVSIFCPSVKDHPSLVVLTTFPIVMCLLVLDKTDSSILKYLFHLWKSIDTIFDSLGSMLIAILHPLSSIIRFQLAIHLLYPRIKSVISLMRFYLRIHF